ncbi:MAG TPA: hypothetical protein EYH47_22005 [Pseudomonas oleovorans]|nr:hypothetical protein [Pseudomonas oleovorans]
MALYFMEYELRKQRDYPTLYAELRRLGAVRVLESFWCFKVDGSSAETIRDHFKRYIDSDDGIAVVQASDWATYKTQGHPNQLK